MTFWMPSINCSPRSRQFCKTLSSRITRKVAKAVTSGASVAARATASAASGAAKTVGRAVSSPLRGLALIAGLGVFALFGVGLYDVEWLGGMIVGALMAGGGALGLHKALRALRPVKANRN